jgi:hypothetical protein
MGAKRFGQRRRDAFRTIEKRPVQVEHHYFVRSRLCVHFRYPVRH